MNIDILHSPLELCDFISRSTRTNMLRSTRTYIMHVGAATIAIEPFFAKDILAALVSRKSMLRRLPVGRIHWNTVDYGNVLKTPSMEVNALLARVVTLLERLVPESPAENDLSGADAFVWQAQTSCLSPVAKVNRVDISLLKGIDRLRDILVDNTRRFAAGLPANNTLLWGARGMGKSSLVKAAHHLINEEISSDAENSALKLIEIHREDIEALPALLGSLRDSPFRFIVFCDDLSFDNDDTSYKSLKAVLEGGIEGRPGNVLFYATSNRRHLMPRDMMENERSTAINPSEAVEEKVSLSDRFGLWIGFHNCSQEEYLEMVRAYAGYFDLTMSDDELRRDALEWSTTRGARSGRVAWQFIQDLAGRLGVNLEN